MNTETLFFKAKDFLGREHHKAAESKTFAVLLAKFAHQISSEQKSEMLRLMERNIFLEGQNQFLSYTLTGETPKTFIGDVIK